MSTKKQFRMRKLIVPLVTLTLLTSGCTSMQIIDTNSAAPLTSVVEIGDELRVTTRDDEVIELVVESVDNGSVTGDGKTIVLDQIQLLEIRRSSPGRTIVLVAVLTVAGLTAIASSGAIAAATW